MTGNELLRRIRKVGRRNGIEVNFMAHQGKGDHGTLYYGGRRTTLGDRGELKTGTLHAMLKQLGLSLEDLR